jgi:hypothetical protein
MNAIASLRFQRTRSAIAISGLCLVGALLLGEDAAGKDKKGEEKKPSSKVDALVNRNQPPKLIKTGGGFLEWAALYPENYDWNEETRVREAMRAIGKENTVELWEEMVRREKDPSYCVTSTSDHTGNAHIETVGTVCHTVAYYRLTHVFRQHLPTSFEGRRIWLDAGLKGTTLAEWRKERKNKAVYELQVEVCESALRDLAKFEGSTQEEKDRSRAHIQGVIENMRKTKQPEFPGSREFALLPFRDFRYDAERAKEVREAVKNGTLDQFSIIK